MAKKEKKPYVVGQYRGWMVPAWASRGVALAANVILLMQISYYCTNALGMDPGITGVLLLVSKLFDGFTDLCAGILVDKTKTKWGKARPYEFAILGVWISTILLFSAPKMGMIGKYIWVFVFYTLVNSVFATMLNATESVYLARALKEDTDRAKLMSFSGIFTIITAIIAIVLPILIDMFGQQEGGWTIISAALGIPLAIIGMGCFLFIKEMDIEGSSNAPRITLGVIWQALKSNKYIVIWGIVMVMVTLANNLGSGVSTYFFQYIYGDISASAVMGALSMVTFILLIIFPALMKKFGLFRLTVIGIALCMAGNLVRLIAPQNMVVLVISALIANLGIIPATTLGSLFVIECMDYGEWKNGVRVEAAYGAITGLGAKIGSAFASAMIGFVMQFAGFDATQAVQSASANFSIIALYSIIPAALFGISLLVFSRYDLSKKIPQIRQELDERRAG